MVAERWLPHHALLLRRPQLAMAAAVDADDATVIDLRTMLNGLSDSVTALTGQMALLMEDPIQYRARLANLSPEAQLTERGPAVRGAEYAHMLQEERGQMQTILERIDTLESNIAFCSRDTFKDTQVLKVDLIGRLPSKQQPKMVPYSYTWHCSVMNY